MRPGTVLLALIALLAGCVDDHDGGPVHLHLGHDFSSQEPRTIPFHVGSGAYTLTFILVVEPADPTAICSVIDPTRVVVLDPAAREVIATRSAGAECARERVEETTEALEGTWAIRFEGNGTLLGWADVDSVGEREPGRARVAR